MSWKPIGFQLFETSRGDVVFYVVYDEKPEFPEMGLTLIEGYFYEYTGKGQMTAQLMADALNELREAAK